MKKTVRKFIFSQVYCYRDLERKLEDLAEKGLFLTTIGNFFYHFEPREPQKVRYAVTFFAEGSVFNPDFTENQLDYMEYAKACGWEFINQQGQMQIFMNQEENPVPFETDPREQLENIKKCTKKSTLPAQFLLILVFSFNVCMQLNLLRTSPTLFFNSNSTPMLLVMMILLVLQSIFNICHYFHWCKRSEASIAAGGGCVETTPKCRILIEYAVLAFALCFLGFSYIDLARKTQWIPLVFGLIQLPFFYLIFNGAIRMLKKKKVTPKTNLIVSSLLLVVGMGIYTSVLFFVIGNFNTRPPETRPYDTVQWTSPAGYTTDHTLFRDTLPITCEDLYGSQDYPYYSYEAEEEHSVFLATNSYAQRPLPDKKMPPQISYEILQPRFSFVYALVEKDLKEVKEWENRQWIAIDAKSFGAKEAYVYTDADGTPWNQYLLLYEDRIITLSLEEAVTAEDILVIREKLGV